MAALIKTAMYILLIYTIICGRVSSEPARLMAELEIADLELADICEDLANGMKVAILEKNFREKITAEKAYGQFLRVGAKHLNNFDNIPSEVQRNWTFLVKPGDGLLSKEDWDTVVSYHNANEELVSVVKVPCINNTDGCIFTEAEYQSILKSHKDVDLLNGTWYAWQHVFNPKTEQYPIILELLKKAASLNDKEDLKSYWEYLNEFNGAYTAAQQFWEEIEPLYIKLHEFVKKRLYKYYNLGDTSEIPVYLLGSNFGMDWSYIADIILPHPQLHYDVESFLKYKNLREIYLLAENLTHTASLGKLGDEFWLNSRFNMTFCQPHIVSFCSQEYSEVYDCGTSSWTGYLDAHETAFNVALRNRDYNSLMRRNLRYSPIDDAISSLGSLLSIESLEHHGIINKGVTSEEDSKEMTKLLLTALRVLPRLSYYLAADEWRLKEIGTPSEDLVSTWWQFRRKYQRVTGVTGVESDFLRDKFITSNKPYLSKFLGDILAFQFLDYYRRQSEGSGNSIAEEVGKDENFLSMINERPITDWQFLLTINYGFDLSPLALLEYFQPLKVYLESAPLEQAPIVTTTTTTTTTPKPTTTTSPSVPRSKVIEKENLLNASWSNDTALNDEPKGNNTRITENEKNASSHIAMYVGIGILVLVSCLAVVVIGYNRVRRRRTNNRRFAT